MKMFHRTVCVRRRLAIPFALVLGLIILAGCGSSNSSTSAPPGGGGGASSSGSGGSSSGTSVDTSKCGTKPGQQATGTPIRIGTIDTKQPGTDFIAARPRALAKAAGVPITEPTENVPINDANSVALDLVNKAGSNGWVVLNFTPPEALVILQAAQKLGLEDRVKGWGCSTPCNTDFLAKALGPKWNHKLFVNAELTSADDHNGPEMQLYKAILAKYGSSVAGGLGSFSEMGYLLGKFITDALQKMKPPYTIKTVNAAIKAIKDEKTELICQPWVYGDYPLHIPNNADFTTTPDNGKMVTAQGCFNISAADPQIAAYRKAAGTAPSTNPPTQ